MAKLEEFCRKDGKQLRMGYTTGSCAAAAAKAAAGMLFEGNAISSVQLMTPKGILLELTVEDVTRGDGWVSCAIRKDSGDDPDITNGILIYARVEFSGGEGIRLEGGQGVGRVTRPGLECPVGAPAINRVPQEMITAAVSAMQQKAGVSAGVLVTISIPEGERLAQRTFNPRLGIVGGLSVLGTSGIVEPMSEAALVESIRAEMKILAAAGRRELIVTPGNYGEDFLKDLLGKPWPETIKCSNFVGETLDMAAELGFRKVLLIGHIGKFVKLAAGIMNTHSRYADGRMEILTAHAALCGADSKTASRLMECITTDDALDLLEQAGLREAVLKSVMKKIEFHLKARSHGDYEVGAVVFSNRHGLLGKTEGAETLFPSGEGGFLI